MTTAMITLRTLYHPVQIERICEYLQKEDGVLKGSVHVWMNTKQATVTFDSSKISINDIILVLESLGHPIFKFRLIES